MKKKIDKLEGAELDLWVAKCENLNARIEDGEVWIYPPVDTAWPGQRLSPTESRVTPVYSFSPHKLWHDAGPLIEDNEINSLHAAKMPHWTAFAEVGDRYYSSQDKSLLVAAMRCYVMLKLDSEWVEI